MAYLIGIDEAGYGPFLGPLCIGATYWSIPDELFSSDVDLYQLLEELVTTTLKDKTRIMIGDSKLAYKPGSGTIPSKSESAGCGGCDREAKTGTRTSRILNCRPVGYGWLAGGH